MKILRKMRIHKAIYWQKTGVTENGTSVYNPPIVIDCRWDSTQIAGERSDNVETVGLDITMYPDRILTIGSFIMYGGDERLSLLSDEEKGNPALLSDAKIIKTQKIVPELQFAHLGLSPGFSDDHVMVEVSL